MTFVIGTPHTRGAGYFVNDDRASGGQRTEADVRTCPHCQAVLLMQQWKQVENGSMHGGWCMRCNAPICHHCNRRMKVEGCRPFTQKIEEAFEMDSKLTHFRKLAGLEPPEPPRDLIVPGTHRS